MFPWNRGYLFKKGIFISQIKYVLDLLKETNKLGCITSGVPIEQNHRIGSEDSSLTEKNPILVISRKTHLFIIHEIIHCL